MTPTETASIKNSIVRQSLAFQREDDERSNEEGVKVKQSRSLQNKALDASNGRVASTRGGIGDGVRKVATLGTGVGGGHGDGVSRRPRRQLCHRIVTPENQVTG